MPCRGLFVGVFLFSLPAVAAEVERAPGAPCDVHVSAAGGIGAAYGLVGGRIEVGACNVSGFVGTGPMALNSGIVGGVAGIRWTPLGRNGWLVLSAHGFLATGTFPGSVYRHGIVAATIGAQLILLQHLRLELAIGPSFSYLRTRSQMDDLPPFVERQTAFGLWPDEAYGPMWPDFAIATGFQF